MNLRPVRIVWIFLLTFIGAVAAPVMGGNPIAGGIVGLLAGIAFKPPSN